MALLFIDLKAAFYSVMREDIMPPPGDAELWRSRLRSLGFSAAEVDAAVLRALDPAWAPVGAGLHPVLRQLLQDWHENSWFLADLCTDVALPWAGVKPGDPLADLMFNWAMARVLTEARARLRELRLFHEAPFGDGTYAFEGFTWVDDETIPLCCSDPVQLVQGVAAAVSILKQVFHGHGMTLNTKRGKSEVLIAFKGKRTKEAKLLLTELDGGPAIALPDGSSIGVVYAYRHLGTRLTLTGSLMPEIRHRISSMKGTFYAQKPFYRASEIRAADRLKCAQSFLATRLVSSAATWDPLTDGAEKALNTAWMMPLRVIAHAPLYARPGYHPHSDRRVRADLGALPVHLLVRLQRLRYVAQAAQHAPSFLAILLADAHQHKAPWQTLVREDLEQLRLSVVPKLDALPDYLQDPAPWQELWRAHPLAWKSLVRVYHDVLVQRIRAADDDSAPALDEEEAPFHCQSCPRAFPSWRSLRAHLMRSHGVRAAGKHYASPTGRCPSCGWVFHTRLRLCRHLNNSKPECLRHCLEHVEPFEPAQVAAWDVLDVEALRQARASGVPATLARMPALPPPPPGVEAALPADHHFAA